MSGARALVAGIAVAVFTLAGCGVDPSFTVKPHGDIPKNRQIFNATQIECFDVTARTHVHGTNKNRNRTDLGTFCKSPPTTTTTIRRAR